VLLALTGGVTASRSASNADPDFGVVLQSWRFADSGCANVEAVWRIDNHGPATDASGQAVFSLNSPGLTFQTAPDTCVGPGPTGPFFFFSVPPLAQGASHTVTTRIHTNDTGFFAIQMHVRVPGEPTVRDANSADNDALLGVHPPLSAPPASTPAPAFTPPPPTITLLKTVATVQTRPGSCRATPPEAVEIFKFGGLYTGAKMAVTYPGGTVIDFWPYDGGFPVGRSRVALSVWFVDPAKPVEAAFDVVATDVQPPKLVPRRQTHLTVDATGSRGARVTFKSPGTIDNCKGVVVTAKPHSGSLFPIGTTKVVFTATDVSGNKATSSIRVTVRAAG